MTLPPPTIEQLEGAARLVEYNLLWDAYRDAHKAARDKRIAAGDTDEAWTVYRVERDAAHAIDPDYMERFRA